MRSLAAFVFPGFQTLDLFGPLELLGDLRREVATSIVAETRDPVPSVHGQKLVVDRTIADGDRYDLLFVPGGDAALDAAGRPEVSKWLAATSQTAELVMTVCTGSILLATTGVLDRRRATTNKADFTATVPLAPKVEWVPQARWVVDGKFFTSSGVSAGMDMALAVVEAMYGRERADQIAEGSEYEWHDDPTWDPFAESNGLVPGTT